jgi:hypothetical protein
MRHKERNKKKEYDVQLYHRREEKCVEDFSGETGRGEKGNLGKTYVYVG